nr:uncharacterized protein LOC117834158 [Setaria viridis]
MPNSSAMSSCAGSARPGTSQSKWSRRPARSPNGMPAGTHPPAGAERHELEVGAPQVHRRHGVVVLEPLQLVPPERLPDDVVQTNGTLVNLNQRVSQRRRTRQNRQRQPNAPHWCRGHVPSNRT